MGRVYGYIRVSTSGQAKEGHSLEDQRDKLEAYCKENSMDLVRIYEDAGISGAKVDEDDLTVDRPGIQDLLADLRDNGVKYVVVLSTSRLWRSDFAKILIQRELKRHSVDVKAIDRPTYSIYNQDPTEVLLNGMMELLDQYERLEINLKLKRGRNKKASKGGYAGGGSPLGYKAARGTKTLTIDESKVPTVKRLFELSRKRPHKGRGKASLQFIADQLNQEGHTTAEGKLFQRVQVKRILDKKKFYEGQYQYGGVVVKQGQHEALLK